MVAGHRSQIGRRGDVMKAVVIALVTVSVAIIAAKGQRDVAGGRVKIVANGESSYTILYASTAPFSVREAAVELQRCVEIATGVRLTLKEGARPKTPIISLGQTDALRESGLSADGMAQESFAERVRGPDVFVFGPDTADGQRLGTGGTSAGTANGVYSILERFLQVRWLFPTDLGRDVPSADTFWVPARDLDGAPRFVSRTLAYIQESDQNVKTWEARMKLGRSKAFEHGHNWFAIKPELFDAHPDWFAAHNGTRVRPSGDRYKLETTAPDLVRAFAGLAIQDFRANPQHYSYSLSPTDSEGWSESPESLGLQERDPHGNRSVTPLVLKFYNDVARIVGQEFPDRELCGYIYAQYLYPPAAGVPKLERNVCLVVAPNIDYGLQLFRASTRQEMQKLVRTWGRAATVTGYYDLPSKLEDDLSAPTPASSDILGFALSTVADAGMQLVYIHGIPSWGFGAPTNYVIAHLEWDPTSNAAELVDEFFVRAYGRAAGSLMKGLNDGLTHALSAFYQKNGNAAYSLTADMLRDVYGPFYPTMERTYLQALAATDTPVHRQRLEWFGRDLTLFRWNLERLRVIGRGESPLAVSDVALLNLLNGWSSDLATSPQDRAAAAKILTTVR